MWHSSKHAYAPAHFPWLPHVDWRVVLRAGEVRSGVESGSRQEGDKKESKILCYLQYISLPKITSITDNGYFISPIGVLSLFLN